MYFLQEILIKMDFPISFSNVIIKIEQDRLIERPSLFVGWSENGNIFQPMEYDLAEAYYAFDTKINLDGQDKLYTVCLSTCVDAEVATDEDDEFLTVCIYNTDSYDPYVRYENIIKTFKIPYEIA